MEVYLFDGTQQDHNIVFEKTPDGTYSDLQMYWGSLMRFRKTSNNYQYTVWLSPDGTKLNWLPRATFNALKLIVQCSKVDWNQHYIQVPAPKQSNHGLGKTLTVNTQDMKIISLLMDTISSLRGNVKSAGWLGEPYSIDPASPPFRGTAGQALKDQQASPKGERTICTCKKCRNTLAVQIKQAKQIMQSSDRSGHQQLLVLSALERAYEMLSK